MTALSQELATDPLGLGYASHLPDSPGRVVDLLNAPTRTAIKPRFVTARGVLAEVDGGAQILDKLEALAGSVSEVKWAMKFLLTDGIDVGHPRTRGLLDALVVGGAITMADAKALKDLALQPASRAEELGLNVITEADLRAALEG